MKIIDELIIQNNLKIKLIKCPSIRNLNGMSLSSRYSNFNEEDKRKFVDCAKIIYSNISDLKKIFDNKIIDKIENELISFGVSKIDYCEVRNEHDLSISKTNKVSRLFIAFYLNKVRVIDNFILY